MEKEDEEKKQVRKPTISEMLTQGISEIPMEAVVDFLPEKEFWTTSEIIKVLDELDHKITGRQIRYRISERKFEPLPKRLVVTGE